MRTVCGTYASAKVFTDTVEDSAIEQIRTMCSQPFAEGAQIRIMPDCHTGAGCTIGTTMTIRDKIVPNLVGVDIGCGVHVTKLNVKSIDFEKLDAQVRRVPSGFSVRSKPHPYAEEIDLNELRCADAVNVDRGVLSLGTLGGGNHFVEADIDEDGSYYLVIHSGSRHLGLETARLYQNRAITAMENPDFSAVIEQMKTEGRASEISGFLSRARAEAPVTERALAYVEGRNFDDYIHDMKIIQHFARLNRAAMAWSIMRGMGWEAEEEFETIHNYIDIEHMILRKGAVSAMKDEKLIIPINMRDGSLICIGKGNPDWNESAPHGAGRLMSRSAAKRELSMNEFHETMNGIYTTCISRDTLDEAPMAYKNMDEIMENIAPTAEVVKIIRPVYNFKAAGD